MRVIFNKTMKMKPEIKKMWVDALSSGNFVQTKHATARRYKGKYRLDVLGVLCMIHKETQPDAKEFSKPKQPSNGALIYGDSDGLPKVVCKWAGLGKCELPYVRDEKGMLRSLHYLNDHGWSFKDLADLIEKQL